MNKRKSNNKIVSLFLSIVIIFSAVAFPLNIFASNEEKKEILSFRIDFEDKVVPIGTSYEDLNLPKILTVSASSIEVIENTENKEELQINVIKWNSNPVYNSSKAGDYKFYPEISKNDYVISEKADSPVINISVAEKNSRASKAGLTVTGGTENVDYTYTGGVITVKSNTPLTISGTTSTDRIMVESGVTADITFDNLNITSNDNNPFNMKGAIVNLHLKNTNTLTAKSAKAVILCTEGSEITIDGDGILNANASEGGGGAAIGGECVEQYIPTFNANWQYWYEGKSPNGASGKITINSGTINANCLINGEHSATYYSGVAIGGYSGGPITINGGKVTAIAYRNSTAIGSLSSYFEGIYINGGEVTAKTAQGTAMNDIAANDCLGPAIGTVGGAKSTIIITGGTVNASSNFGCAGIGGGKNGPGGTIIITGTANVTAKGGFGAAGIGGGYAQNGGGHGGNITINGNAVVKATGGDNASGIGGCASRQNGPGISQGFSGIITISGNADITANGGINAPGIGSGGNGGTNMDFPDANRVQTITIIENAKVNSKGGTGSVCDIGPGRLPAHPSTPSPEERFDTFICTVPGVTTQVEAKNSILINADGNYEVKGTVELNTNFTVPEGKKLILTAGSELKVPKDVILNYPYGALDTSSGGIVSNTGGQIIEGTIPPVTKYTLTIENGTGSGSYEENTEVNISASIPVGKEFMKWEQIGPGSIKDLNLKDTIFTVGKGNATVTAVFKDKATEDTPTITKVEVSPKTANVQKGTTQQFTANVEGTGKYDNTVTWSVTGGVSGTTITSNGLLTIDKEETASSITVTAVSNGDTSKKDMATVSITDTEVKKYSLIVENGTGSGSYEENAEINISASIPTGKEFMKWEQSGPGSIKDLNLKDTTFIVGKGNATVKAVFKNKATEDTPTITKVKVSPKTANVQKGTTQQFTINIEGTGNYDNTVTWSITGGVSGTTITSNGLLTIDKEETASSITVTAVSNGDTSKKDMATVSITDTEVKKYSLTVENGTGSGSYEENAEINISASIPAGKEFMKWEQSGPGSIKDLNLKDTTFTVGKGNAIVTAVFKDKATEDTPTITKVKVSPKTANVQKGSTQQFTANIEGTGKYDNTVTWIITGGVSGTTIDSNGLLTVDKEETALSITVTAVSNADTSKKDMATVSITDTEIKKYNLTVNGGTGSGNYEKDVKVSISASIPSGKLFDRWILISGSGIISNVKLENTTFTMSSSDAVVKASFKDEKKNSSGGSSGGSGSSAGSSFGSSSSSSSSENDSQDENNSYLENQNAVKNDSQTTDNKNTESSKTFNDVSNHWAKDDIEFVVSRNILSGTGNNEFSPNTSMTRGMFVTALGRLENINTTDYSIKTFSDVANDSYYASYVEWAFENGIVSGTGNDNFSPDKPITRQEMAVIMTNYIIKMGYTLSSDNEPIVFNDENEIADWAIEAVKFMQEAGILSGKNGNKFDPKGTATRAEVSSVLRRFIISAIDK